MENRAKQFMPFDALKGLRKALKEKERIRVERIELSEDYREELDRKFQEISVGTIVNVIYYDDGEYLQVTGMISKIDLINMNLTIVDTQISVKDIYDLNSTESN